MTNDSGHSDDKGGGKQPPKDGTPPRNNVLPIDKGRGVGRRPWPISAPGLSMNSAAGLLVVVGVLCGLLISESDRNSPVVSPRPEARSQGQGEAPNPAPAQVTPLAKPSPAIRSEPTRAAAPVEIGRAHV